MEYHIHLRFKLLNLYFRYLIQQTFLQNPALFYSTITILIIFNLIMIFIKIRVEMTVDYMKVNIMINELNLFLQGAAML